MKILIIVGSAHNNSHSLHLGRAIGESLVQKEASVEIIDLAEDRLPMFDREIDLSQQYDEQTVAFLEKSRAADSFVWVTPVYHNSYSSTIKNALDWQHRITFDGKVVGMASNGGNRAPVAIDPLMMVARSQHLIISPARVCTQEDDYDDALNISSETIKKRIEGFTDELIFLTKKFLRT